MAMDYLFNRFPCHGMQHHQRDEMLKEIAALDGNRLLNTPPDDLASYFAEKYLIPIPVLDESAMHVDQNEVQVDVSREPGRDIRDRSRPLYVPGVKIIVAVPFEGDHSLFHVQPDSSSSAPPKGGLSGSEVVLILEGTNLTEEGLKAEIHRWLGSVRKHLQVLTTSFNSFNGDLRQIALQAINDRRRQLLANQSLVANLGIPLKRRPDTERTYVAPNVKRKVIPRLPPATAGMFRPEPALDQAEYEHILKIMRSMVDVMERSPQAFQHSDEESLRTHFLVALNANYDGQATGETFNYQGKTDIFIRAGERGIFIAECKFWTGPEGFRKAIDQLLGYLSWRDSKAAILIFNRNKDFSKVLASIPEATAAHPKFKRAVAGGDTNFRYIFRHQDDDAKELQLTILAFDVPRAA